MLKHHTVLPNTAKAEPAAFGRLCVETGMTVTEIGLVCQPPSGGCVLKQFLPFFATDRTTSRLRAAVC